MARPVKNEGRDTQWEKIIDKIYKEYSDWIDKHLKEDTDDRRSTKRSDNKGTMQTKASRSRKHN